jgi:hypothetical protein
MIFLWVSIIGFYTWTWFMKKRIPRQELFFVAMFSISFQQLVDAYINLKFELYGYFNKGVATLYFVPATGLMAPAGMIIMNYYPFGNWKKIVRYVSLCTVLVVIFELLSLKAGYFYYNGWNIWYSVAIDPFLILTIAHAVKIYRYLTRRDANKSP